MYGAELTVSQYKCLLGGSWSVVTGWATRTKRYIGGQLMSTQGTQVYSPVPSHNQNSSMRVSGGQACHTYLVDVTNRRLLSSLRFDRGPIDAAQDL